MDGVFLVDRFGNALSSSNPLSIALTGGGQTAASQYPVAVTQAPKGPYQTMKTFTFVLTTSITVTVIQTLYTVTAGKTFYLTDVSVCNNTANAAQVTVNASATAGASPIMTGHSLNTCSFELANIGTEPSVSGGNPLTFQSLLTTAVTTLAVFVSGYEQ